MLRVEGFRVSDTAESTSGALGPILLRALPGLMFRVCLGFRV